MQPPGLFETILVVDGEPRWLAEHVARVRSSYRECYGAQLTADVVGAVRAAVLPGVSHQRVRVEVGPDRPDRAVAVAAVCEAPRPPAQQTGLTLATRKVTAGTGHKTIDRSLMERAEATVDASTCALLVGPAGQVWETTRSNVFAVIGSAVLTPPVDGNVLPGITRSRVLDLLSRAGVECRVERLSLARLAAADGAFVTNSVRGPRWVCKLTGSTGWAVPHRVLDLLWPDW